MYLDNNLDRGLAMALKSLINLLKKPACPRKDLMSLIVLGIGRLDVNSIFALSTFIPFLEVIWPRTIL